MLGDIRLEESRYVEAASNELLRPRLELTKQYLETLEVKLQDGFPCIARVDSGHADKPASVWFQVEGERFFLVVQVQKRPSLEASWVSIEASNDVYLTANSEKKTYSELAAMTTLRPLEGWSKGDQRRGRTTHTFSRVSFKPLRSEAYELEVALGLVLAELEADPEGVRRLAREADARIAVNRHQYVGSNAGIHLDLETMLRMTALELPLDIDTYMVGQPPESDRDTPSL